MHGDRSRAGAAGALAPSGPQATTAIINTAVNGATSLANPNTPPATVGSNAAAAALAAGASPSASNNAGKLAALSAVLSKFNGKNNIWYSNQNLNALSRNVNSAATGVNLNKNSRERLEIIKRRINAARAAKAPPNAALTSANKYKTMNIKNLLEAVKSVSKTNRNALRAAILAKKVAWRGGPQTAKNMGNALSKLANQKTRTESINDSGLGN